LGFCGQRSDFANPDNSFIHRVYARRRGLPITLSVLYASVGRAAGIPVAGIALPGHFVVGRLDVRPPLVLDPFHGGRPLSQSVCDRIVRQVTRGQVSSADRYFVPTTPRAVLSRMLANLQMVYWDRRDDLRGLLAARLYCVLEPADPEPVRMRGYFYDRLGDAQAALADFECYLRRAPDTSEARRLRPRVVRLRHFVRESPGRQ
jgi:regulator of sirC expression with transglutaminase-like and TPR domain